MVVFTWLEKNNTGITEIDEQHKGLLTILNELYQTMRSKKDSVAASKLLSKLVNYANIHFKTEEKYMEEYEYSDIEKHKELHEFYREKIAGFQRDFAQSKGSLVVDMASFLSEWLIDHIGGADRDFAHFVKNNKK